ncbi:MAG: hypothetical protein ACM3PU_11240 [Gemmatimonadota bacterium]
MSSRLIFALRAALAALLAVAVSACATPPAGERRGGLSFALLGDMPYYAPEVHAFDALLDAINADPSIQFVMHVGDIKGAGEPCTDELLRERYEQLQRIRTALVYTPGDNEWTDCHRRAAGRFNPLERLAFLRSLFFADPRRTSGQQPFSVEPQSATAGFGEFVENALFVRARVVFATLNMVGSDNDMEPWSGLDPSDTVRRPRADRVGEVRRRTAAALSWIDHAFERARAIDAAGVFLLMQANPRFDLAPNDPSRRPFEPLLRRLHERASAFGRPVVLAHGDFHQLVIDRPFARPGETAAVANLIRVQTFGSPWIRWIRVHVDPDSPEVFRFTPN